MTDSMTADRRAPCLSGILVTHRRPESLATGLRAVATQTRLLTRLVVVDNAPEPATRDVVADLVPGAEYVPTFENLGPAGGIALGMERILEDADDDDWVVTLDDDDPPTDPALFERMAAFAEEMRTVDPSVGAVGVSGVRFDRTRGQIRRVPDDELRGAVPVDSIAGNEFPLYSVRALRSVGPFRRDLFFGFEELEFGWRLRAAGYTLYAHGPSWFEHRKAAGRLGREFTPSRSLGAISWRRYYSLRNLVRILCDYGSTYAAVRVTIVAGFAKPLANLSREPLLASRHLALNARAVYDGWTHRMGRTVDPST